MVLVRVYGIVPISVKNDWKDGLRTVKNETQRLVFEMCTLLNYRRTLLVDYQLVFFKSLQTFKVYALLLFLYLVFVLLHLDSLNLSPLK
jgi:hypothetical protein